MESHSHAATEMFSDVPLSTMFPVEAAAIAGAAANRRSEFATVRHCARLDQVLDGLARMHGGALHDQARDVDLGSVEQPVGDEQQPVARQQLERLCAV